MFSSEMKIKCTAILILKASYLQKLEKAVAHVVNVFKDTHIFVLRTHHLLDSSTLGITFQIKNSALVSGFENSTLVLNLENYTIRRWKVSKPARMISNSSEQFVAVH